MPHDENEEIKLKYDLEWLTILMTTNHLLSVKESNNHLPGPYSEERLVFFWVLDLLYAVYILIILIISRKCFKPTEEETNIVLSKLENDLTVPENFEQTSRPYDVNSSNKVQFGDFGPLRNPQTAYLCKLLSIDDPIELILESRGQSFSESNNSSFCANNSGNKLDETNDTTSFIDDTICEEKSPVKKSSLNFSLPEPKNDSNDLFFIDTEPSPVSKKRSSSLNLPEPKNISQDSFFIDTEPSTRENSWKRKSSDSDDVEKEDNKISCKSNQKKFKRRNFNIYNSEDNSI